jgi:hypothetical protein
MSLTKSRVSDQALALWIVSPLRPISPPNLTTISFKIDSASKAAYAPSIYYTSIVTSPLIFGSLQREQHGSYRRRPTSGDQYPRKQSLSRSNRGIYLSSPSPLHKRSHEYCSPE